MTLIGSAINLLVVGAQNPNPADQTMAAADVRSMQLLDSRLRFTQIPFFDSWGDLSSVAQHPDDPFQLYLASASEVFEMHLRERRCTSLDVPGLSDIHEITFRNGELWIASTADDEVVLFDTEKHRVTGRIDLRTVLPKSVHPDNGGELVDTFHVNQAFHSYEGDLFALAHHHSGHQELTLVAQKLVKRQGDGGVVNITKRVSHNLGLKAPHSVRLVDGNYWVFDSGRFEIKMFNKRWELIRTVATRGFGRGADHLPESNLFYVGISATRKRYLGLLPRGEAVPNLVQVFDTRTFTEKGSINVPNIEQVNNVYCLSTEVAEALINLS